jgi:hypothetical protein
MFNPGMYGEMFTLLPIYAAALLLGLISGAVAVYFFTSEMGRFSIRALMGIVVLASLVFCLVAAEPEFWEATASFWAMAAMVMAAVDLFVVSLVDPWRKTRRFPQGSVRRRVAWSTLGTAGAVAGVLAVLKLRFDIPLRTEALPSFVTGLVVAVLVLTGFDLAAHLAVIHWSRCRRISRTAGHCSGT